MNFFDIAHFLDIIDIEMISIQAKTFRGGVHPESFKALTKDKSIASLALPKNVAIPLLQNTGRPADPIVKSGDTVLKGQLIGESISFISSKVHASLSGKVTAVGEVINPIYGKSNCVFIESDGRDLPHPSLRGITSPESLSREKIVEIIKNAGIVGLGGAAFPTHVKLLGIKEDKNYSLIINGAECEPFLTCDQRLMVENSEEILKGIRLLAKASNAKDVHIAIENNKPKAIRAMKKAAVGSGYRIVTLKTKYPQGGEKQLIKAILGREVPPEKLPLDVDCIVQNVGTAFAAYEAVYKGLPLIERCVTLTGSCLKNPGNFRVRIGTLLTDIVQTSCGGFVKEPAKIILGGPMMGIAHYSADIPIIKGITGVVFLSREEAEVPEESICVKCGRCVDVCPVNLLPTEIVKYVKRKGIDYLDKLNVFDCIECGACSFGCAARIPIVQYIKLAKKMLRKQ